MVGTTAVGCAKSVIKLTGSTMKAIDYEEENTKRVTALELTGGPAHGGLTVLDWFAGKALEGLVNKSPLVLRAGFFIFLHFKG